jgi:hypothetical protein
MRHLPTQSSNREESRDDASRGASNNKLAEGRQAGKKGRQETEQEQQARAAETRGGLNIDHDVQGSSAA